MTESAADLGGGRTGGEADDLVFLNQLRGGEADVALLGGVLLFAGLEGDIVAEGLVEERLHQRRTAVGTTDEAALFEGDEVPTDAGSGGAGKLNELFNCAFALAEEPLHDSFCASLGLGGHRGDSGRAEAS